MPNGCPLFSQSLLQAKPIATTTTMAVRVGPLRIASLIVIFTFLCSSAPADGQNLQVDYYRKTCPRAEKIINDAVMEAISSDPGVAAALVRLYFHDCFVKGCDASILLEETPSGEAVEMTSLANKGVRGIEVIDEAKSRLEKECPETVSCADIVAFAARDASVASGLRYYYVPAGRRDGLTSRAMDTKGNLPKGSSNVSEMVNVFIKKGLTVYDLVTLLGSHSFGVSHCSSFDYRLYNYSQIEATDPAINELFAFTLKLACPETMSGMTNNDLKVHFDYITPTRLDNFFYLRVLTGKALLHSDQELSKDPMTREIVKEMALNPELWNTEFGKSMVKMGNTEVLTGKEGEIRRCCHFVNKNKPIPLN